MGVSEEVTLGREHCERGNRHRDVRVRASGTGRGGSRAKALRLTVQSERGAQGEGQCPWARGRDAGAGDEVSETSES